MMMLQDNYSFYIISTQKRKTKNNNQVQIKSGCQIFDLNIFIMQKQFPNQIKYKRVAPKGYPSIYKQWINDPLTGNKTWAKNDIVRWNFMNSKRGTFDPYRSFIQITVSCNVADMPVGLLQIDNSAHSFINQIVLYSNNRQIQRITQYSVLLSYLNDIGLNQFLSQGRQAEGLGYGSFDTMPYSTAQNRSSQSLRNLNNTVGGFSNSIATVFPTIGNNFPQFCDNIDKNSIYNASRSNKGHATNSNPVLLNEINGGSDPDTSNKTAITASMYHSGYANNFRAQYMASILSGKYPQSPQSIPNWQTSIGYQVGQQTYPFRFGPGKVYQPYFTPLMKSVIQGTNGTSQTENVVNSSNYGFGTLFSPNYTRGTFQPFISPTVPQCSMQNGIILPTKIPIVRRKFKIPLASAVIGCLIDPSSYCLIPLQSINDCLLELTLDQYAMFTSGYNDLCQLDDIGIKIQQSRCWNIQRLQYKLHTYFFVENQIEQYIKASLYEQIVLVNNFWALGNQYQIQGGTQVNNTYIVGCSSTHLNEVVCLFVSNDYQRYSFCRKHFRLSNNIRRFWSKLAVDYWPPQPFKGNGGNICSNQLENDNTVFIQNLYWANNYMFAKNSLPRINPYNFAINDRSYDPTVSNTFYEQSMLNNRAYTFKKNSINTHTGLGMSYLHQNRYVGKAAYIIPYTPFTSQDGLLQGINVSGLSNFQVVFQTDSTSVYPRDQTLYIFCKSSVIVKYSKQGITTIGR